MSNLEMTPELAEAIKNAASAEDITVAVQAAMVKQSLADEQTAAQKAADAKAAADKAAADKAAADAAAPQVFSATEVIGGREFTFEAPTEVALQQMIINAYKVAGSTQPATVEIVDPAAEAAAQKAQEEAATAEAARLAELKLKFQRNEIDVDTYLQESNAVATYLEQQGIPLDELRESVERGRGQDDAQSWSEAVEEFLQGPGADWPGGDKNRELIGMKIAQLGLEDTNDKVEALMVAYNELRKNGVLFPAETASAVSAADKTAADAKAAADKAAADKAAADKAAANAATASASAVPTPGTPEFDAYVAALVAKAVAEKTPTTRPATSSSIFGASSGVQQPTATTPEKADAQRQALALAKDASPQEILAAWKEQQIKAGISPDDAFRAAFGGR